MGAPLLARPGTLSLLEREGAAAPEPNPNQAHLVNPTITLTRCTWGVRSWDPPTLPPELRSRLARGVRSWDPPTLPPELRSRLARTTRGVDHCILWAARIAHGSAWRAPRWPLQPPATSQASPASQHPAGRRSSDGLVVLEVRVFHLFLCFDSHGPRDAGGPRPTGRYIDIVYIQIMTNAPFKSSLHLNAATQ